MLFSFVNRDQSANILQTSKISVCQVKMKRWRASCLHRSASLGPLCSTRQVFKFYSQLKKDILLGGIPFLSFLFLLVLLFFLKQRLQAGKYTKQLRQTNECSCCTLLQIHFLSCFFTSVQNAVSSFTCIKLTTGRCTSQNARSWLSSTFRSNLSRFLSTLKRKRRKT